MESSNKIFKQARERKPHRIGLFMTAFCGFVFLTACAQLEKIFIGNQEIVKKDGCVIVVDEQLSVCETDEKIKVVRRGRATSWPKQSFRELMSRKIEMGLSASHLKVEGTFEIKLSVFSNALETQKIDWAVVVEDDAISYGFVFPESPSEWQVEKPKWAMTKRGSYRDLFTGRLLIQWNDINTGLPKDLWTELFPKFKVIQTQGSVWELAIPLSDWGEFQKSVLEDSWTSRRFAAVKVVPYSAPLGRKREIMDWIWQPGETR